MPDLRSKRADLKPDWVDVMPLEVNLRLEMPDLWRKMVNSK